MKKKVYLGALDLGSQYVTYLLGEVTQQQLNLIGHARIPSEGITKAQVIDRSQLIKLLGHFFEDLTKRYALLPEQLCLSQSGTHLRFMQYETSLDLKGFQHVIDTQDVDQVNQLALHKELPEKEVFLHHVRQFYVINDVCVDNPLGHSAGRLTVCYNALLGKTQAIKDQLYVVNQFGFRVKNLVFSGIASALSTTTPIERENGICVINLGAQMTEFVVYKHRIPVLMGTLPVGGQNFTYDLGSGLRVHAEDAERLKINYGIPYPDQNVNDEDIWLHGDRSIGDKQVKLKNVRTILQVRAQEIFDYIHKFFKEDARQEWLLSGVVLTGGGALLKNIEKIAAQSFKCDCYVRGPLASVDETLKDPAYATCFGLLHYALQQTEKPEASSFWQRISSWFVRR